MTCYKKEIKERKKETLLFFGYKEIVSHSLIILFYSLCTGYLKNPMNSKFTLHPIPVSPIQHYLDTP